MKESTDQQRDSIQLKKSPIPKPRETKKPHYQNKLVDKVNKMEDEINKLKELCQKQNESLSTILHHKSKTKRSKSIDYNVDNYYTQKQRIDDIKKVYDFGKSHIGTSNIYNSRPSNIFRNTTPEVY